MDYKDARIEALQERFAWLNLFLYYIKEKDHDMYNKASEYAENKLNYVK